MTCNHYVGEKLSIAVILEAIMIF